MRCSDNVSHPHCSKQSSESFRLLENLGFNTSSPGEWDELRNLNDGFASGLLDRRGKLFLHNLLAKHVALAGSLDALPISSTFLNDMRCENETFSLPSPDHTLSRVASVVRFINANKAVLENRRFFRCLEWPPKVLNNYLTRGGLTTCGEAWAFAHVDPYVESPWGIDSDNYVIRGDLRLIRGEFPALEGMFDLILCENVLEHVDDPLESLKSMAFLLSRGGVLLLMAPFLMPFHGGGFYQYPDFFRYTTQGITALVARSGLQNIDVKAAMVGGLLSVGYLLGLGTCDFSDAILDANMISRSNNLYRHVFALAIKNMTTWFRRKDAFRPQRDWRG